MNKVAIYIRVSTSHQVDKDSLPLQEKDLKNYAKLILNTNKYKVYKDAGFSAKNTDRPAYQEMMSDIREGKFTHLLVWKIDRISRNLLDFCDMYNDLKKYKCTFISKNEQFDTSSAMGEAMLKIILVFAELERKLTGERVTAVMLDRASKGLWNGAPVPLGYKWDAKIKFPVPDEKEVKTVNLIFDTYLKTESTSAVRNFLNANGIKTKRNGTWTTKTIADVIRNPFYIGTYRYNYREQAHGSKKDEKEWIVLENNHESIIDKALWNKCNEIMDKNAERNSARFRDNSKIHILSQLVECGECHANMIAKQDKFNADGFRPTLFACKTRYNHLGCTQKTFAEKYILEFIFNVISNICSINRKTKLSAYEKIILTNTSASGIKDIDIENFYNNINMDYYSNKEKEDSNDNFKIEQLEKEREKYNRALIRLDDLYLFDDVAMSEKDYILKKNSIKSKLDDINIKFKQLNKTSNKESNFITKAKMLMLNLELKNNKIIYKDIVNNVGRETLKDFMNNILNKVIVKDKKIITIKFKNNLELNFIYPEMA